MKLLSVLFEQMTNADFITE